ncbi:MAG TPA: hydrogenase expression/formation protein HypE [Polyangiaceae bacterium]
MSVFDASCPLPIETYERIVLGHGSGGRMSAELIERVFLPAFQSSVLDELEDQALLAVPGAPGVRLAVTTDAFVVRPLFFPGGDIGKLAICGTVNDLAVGGAIPRAVTAAFVLEEGLLLADLERVVRSMARAAAELGVEVVAGDTKVVERGKGDGIFVTTTGIGWVPAGRRLSIADAEPGQRLLVSGTIGDHGIAILSLREGLEFETALVSDCAGLSHLTQAMLEVYPSIRAMRDPTRGGLSGVTQELATRSDVGVVLDERALPVRSEVRAACELFGLDPLYVACEGRLVAVVPAEDAEGLLALMRAHPLGRDAAIVGEVVAEHPGVVTMRSRYGAERIVPQLSGEQLPRIC